MEPLTTRSGKAVPHPLPTPSTSKPAAKRLRKDTDRYLIGPTCDSICGSKLPTVRQVMQFILHSKKCKQDEHMTYLETVTKVISFWETAGIKTVQEKICLKRLKGLYTEWNIIKKGINRKTESQREKEESFQEKLDRLWDIGAEDAVQVMLQNRLLSDEKRREDISFYEDQQGPRKATMSGHDKVFGEKVKLQEEREQKKRQPSSSWHKEKTEEESLDEGGEESQGPEDMLEDEDRSEDYKEDSAVQIPGPSRCVPLNIPRSILKSPAIIEMADRLNLSNNQLVGVVSTVLRSAEPPAELEDFAISRSSAFRARAEHRPVVAQAVRDEFQPPTHAVLHWDGAMVDDALGTAEHRLAVLVSGAPQVPEGKLLSIPTLRDGTGLAQAEATIAAVRDWGLEDSIVALCFDTTATNTGRIRGAATRLQDMLGRRLLLLGCRHHMMELIISAVSVELLGKTTGPNNKLFEEFKARWSEIDVSEHTTLHVFDPWLQQLRTSVIAYLSALLNSGHRFMREDYREMAELSLIALGVQPPRGERFMRPGAFHHARWMSKVLYIIKMYLFSGQLGYSEEMTETLHRFVQFILLLYVSAWLRAPLAADAPANDLQLYLHLVAYKRVDKEVCEAALRVVRRHVWYLRPSLVVFSLFSQRVTIEEKTAISEKLLTTPRVTDVPDSPVLLDESTKLRDLVDESSWLLFEVTLAGHSWLERPPTQWSEDGDYNALKDFVDTVKVTNDVAERGIAIVKDFAGKVKSEAQFQWLLQAVERHRGQLPRLTKAALSGL